MKTSKFFELLEQNQDKELLFEYKQNEFVPKAYHITEVKNLHFDSVDCGGNQHAESQTIVQLWVSPLERKSKYMESGKALKIMEKVDNIKPIKLDTEVYFEYGNKELPTSNYAVRKVAVKKDQIILKLFVPATSCKPVELKNLVSVISGCCGGLSKCC